MVTAKRTTKANTDGRGSPPSPRVKAKERAASPSDLSSPESSESPSARVVTLRKLTTDLAKKFASYDFWKAKGFILLADAYVQLDDRFQAKTTLQSVIDHCDDPGLVEEARRRLDVIEQSEVQPQAPQKQEQPEIDMNDGNK